VGSKDAQEIMAPYRWVEQIEAELAAGAWKVICEARESGDAGIFRADGEVRMGLIDEIAHAVDPSLILFEAPRKDQQVWFLRRFGREVNLGNIPPGDVLSLETLRLGLRADTAGWEA
jgi:phosphosulfolactate synthase